MFETATWRTENRRHFAVVERLYQEVGLTVKIEDWNLGDHSEFAALLAHQVGAQLLSSSIAFGTSQHGKVSNRRKNKAWAPVEPEAGARAAIFLTLAMAAMLSSELVEGLAPQPVEHARLLVQNAYSPPDEDLEAIEAVNTRVLNRRSSKETQEATERGGFAANMIVEDGRAALCFQALELAGADPANMPAFEFVADVDQSQWYDVQNYEWFEAVSMVFPPYWNAAEDRFLEIAFAPFVEAE